MSKIVNTWIDGDRRRRNEKEFACYWFTVSERRQIIDWLCKTFTDSHDRYQFEDHIFSDVDGLSIISFNETEDALLFKLTWT